MNASTSHAVASLPDSTIRSRIEAASNELSPAERKVARALLADYPVAGLETVARLAERARVSGPSVIRFATRLGFAGYPELQDALRHEVQERLSSPLVLYERHTPPAANGHVIDASRTVFAQALEATFADLPRSEFDAVVELLADRRRSILCVGGRFSQILAYYLVAHLNMLRPNARVIGFGPIPISDELIDLGKRDVLVLFDYRRHQTDTIEAARRAASHGATIVLFTDPWLSPIADLAHHVLPSRVEAPSPFDSLVSGLAVVEAVVAGLSLQLGEAARPRIEELERLRTGVTWESARLPSQEQ